MAQPITHAVALTESDRPTMDHKVGSKDVTNCAAVWTLSRKDAIRNYGF
jgi:hypothetical protein